MNKIESLRAKNAQLAGSMEALTAAAETAGQNLTAEQSTQFDQFDAEFQANEAEIKRLERLEAVKASLGAPAPRVVPPAMSEPTASGTGLPAQGATTVTGGTPVAHNFQNHGFSKGFGEYLVAVRAAKTSGRVDQRLMVNAITTFAGETVGGDGGYLVPPQFQQGIMALIAPQDSFLRALNPISTNSNLISIPADEDAPWSTSGVTNAVTAEGGSITASKPAMKKINVVMHNVKSLVHVSNESLRDVSFLASYVQQKMAQKLRWKVENYVVNGTGNDQPRGILNAPGLLSVSSDIASSTTVLAPDDLFVLAASAMQSPGGFWIVHPLVRAQLWSMKSDATAGYPLFVVDATSAAKQSLLGEPLYVSEACKPYNTAGDIIHVSPDGYVLAFEAGGVQNATSLEFAFDQDLTSFRATLRMGGEPTLSGTIKRADGTNYTSNLCVLAARS